MNYENWEEDKIVSRKRLAILDSDTVLYLCLHNKKDEPIKTLEEVIRLADECIQSILNELNADFYVCCYTVSNNCNFRKKFYPNYKANRLGKELPPYFQELKHYLLYNSKAKFKAVICIVNGVSYEADDLCLSYYTKYKDEYDCIIASPDKDIKNLDVGQVYDYKKNEYSIVNKEEANYYFFKSMLVGDGADGISGIPGIGKDNQIFKIGSYGIDDTIFAPSVSYVISTYIYKYGQDNGIEQFYATYKALKILDKIEGFELPKINEYKR